MKSATSFFNLTLMKKNLTRFWPVWALYTVIWIYVLPVQLLDAARYRSGESLYAYVVRMLCSSSQFGLGLAVVFGILTAMAMFSYLYSPRSTGLFHALPVRREGLFLSAYVSGLACMLLPHAVIWLLALAVQAPHGIALGTTTMWFLVQSGMCIFFYSFAVFCAVFTGHLLALPLFYGILNALAGVLYILVELLFRAYLYGFAGLPESAEGTVMWLVPIYRMVAATYTRTTEDGTSTLGEPWVIGVYTVAGLILAAIALAVYRHRHSETAGDVVAVPLVKPLFKYGVAVCSCLCFGFWMSSVLLDLSDPVSLTLSLLAWAAVGYFVAEMLLRKSFRVLGAWKGCLVLLAVVLGCVLGLQMDFFGFANRIPKVGDVDAVSITSLRTYPFDSGRYTGAVDLTDPDTIARVVDLHQAVLDRHAAQDDAYYDDGCYFDVTYLMKNGSALSRHYFISYRRSDPVYDAFQALVDDPAVGLSGYHLESIDPDALSGVSLSRLWNTTTQEFDYISLSNLDLPNSRQAMRAVYDAVMADFAEGNLGRRYLLDDDPERLSSTCWTDLQLEWEVEHRFISGSTSSNNAVYYNNIQITLTPQAVHTIRVLTELGLLDGEHELRLYRDGGYSEKYYDYEYEYNSFPTFSDFG